MSTFEYIEPKQRDIDWGIAVNTVGYEGTQPGEDYPPKHHPASHYYTPKTGRTLNEYAIIYVTEGEGLFESKHTPLTKVVAGTAFMLFPGEWHNYYPNPETGWSHIWICFNGEDMDNRMAKGFISLEKPVANIGLHDDIISLYMNALNLAEQRPENYQIMLAGIVNHLLGILYTYRKDSMGNRAIWTSKINEARMIMLENVESDISIHDIADKLSMSYSAFRQNFKKHIGESPAAYFQTLKIRRAVDLLRNTSMPVKEIATVLNFSSWDNFCFVFRQKTGKRPTSFRK